MRSDTRGSSEGIVQDACGPRRRPSQPARSSPFSFTPDYYPHFRQESLGTIQSSLTRRPYYSWFFRALKDTATVMRPLRGNHYLMVFDNLMNPFLEVKWQRLEVKGGVVIVRGKQLQWLSPNPPALPPKKVRYFVKDH